MKQTEFLFNCLKDYFFNGEMHRYTWTLFDSFVFRLVRFTCMLAIGSYNVGNEFRMFEAAQ